MTDSLRTLGRFAVGRDLKDGHATDAGWKLRGTRSVDAMHPGRWAHLPHRRRAAIRWAAVLAAGVILYGVLTGEQAIWTVVKEMVYCGAAMTVYFWVHRSRKWAHYYNVVTPLADLVRERFGLPRHGNPQDIVEVPRGYKVSAHRPIKVKLPSAWRETQRQQQAFAAAIANRAGLKSHDFDIAWDGPVPVFSVFAKIVPPDEALFSDPVVRKIIDDNWDPELLFFGMGLYSAPVWISWAQDSPHLAISYGSGGGKTTAVRSLAAQTVRKGGRAALMDGGKEGESHQDWSRDENLEPIPGVEMYHTIPEEHDALIAWDEERARRSKAGWHRTGEEFQRALIVLEERNLTMPMLRSYWANIRGKGDPVTSPAVQAIANLVNAGRAVGINCVAVAQRFDAKAIGGGDVRASFMLRALANFDEGGRRMLIPDITPKPLSSKHKGRTVLCSGSEAQDVQGTLMTAEEAREYAQSGAPQPGPSPVAQSLQRLALERLARGEAAASQDHEPQASALVSAHADDEVPHLAVVPDPDEEEDEELITLADFADLVSIPEKTVRNARDRSRDFPGPEDTGPHGVKFYRLDLLHDWNERRAQRTMI